MERRTKPIALGIIHVPWLPGSVWGGGGPERSRPHSRPKVSGPPLARRPGLWEALSTARAPPAAALQRDAALVVGAAAPLLRLQAPTPGSDLPRVSRSGTPISSASANFSPGPAWRSSSRASRPARAQLAVELSAALASSCPACPGRRDGRPTAPSSAATRSLLVGELLDRRGGDACRADAVGAHPDELLLAVLVEVRGAQRLG